MEASIVDEIIKLKGKIPINIKQPNNNIETTYTYKNENKKFYYYHCTNVLFVKERENILSKKKFSIFQKYVKILKFIIN